MQNHCMLHTYLIAMMVRSDSPLHMFISVDGFKIIFILSWQFKFTRISAVRGAILKHNLNKSSHNQNYHYLGNSSNFQKINDSINLLCRSVHMKKINTHTVFDLQNISHVMLIQVPLVREPDLHKIQTQAATTKAVQIKMYMKKNGYFVTLISIGKKEIRHLILIPR